MTPEERAQRLWDYLVNAGDKYSSAEQMEVHDVAAIAAAIRDAVEEANIQARAALEPFARAAERFHLTEPSDTDHWQLNSHTGLIYGQLRAARDAYLALVGKLE